MGTPVAPLAGTVEITVGRAAVVKVHTKLAAGAMPSVFNAPVVMVAVNTVLKARGALGVNVATEPVAVYATVPATEAPPAAVSVKVDPVMLAGFIGPLKVAETAWLIRTPVAPFTGLVDTTRGGVEGTVSLPHPLAKVRETDSNATKSPVIPSLRVNI